MRLSLDDAIHTTLEKNIGVQLQRYDLRMAGAQVLGAYGIFDPFAGATLESLEQPEPGHFARSRPTAAPEHRGER